MTKAQGLNDEGLDRFSKRMSEMTDERGDLSGKERPRRLWEP